MSRGGFGYGRFGGNFLDLVFGMRIELFTYYGKNAYKLDFLDALKACPFRLSAQALSLLAH